MDVIHDEIRDAIEKELCGANERFPLFASPHEAIAVIAEERDEAADELDWTNRLLTNAWGYIKRNESKNVLDCFARARFAAEKLAIEACQVAAMCEKAIQSAASWDDETEGNKKHGVH